jgi:hypothetical protein
MSGTALASPAATVNVKCVLSSERAPIITNIELCKYSLKEKEKWSRNPDGGLTLGETGCPTVCHKIRLNLTLDII